MFAGGREGGCPGIGRFGLWTLLGLFAIQRSGTGAVGCRFGPLIPVRLPRWRRSRDREVLLHRASCGDGLPTLGARFTVDHLVGAFRARGRAVLTVITADTGYVDRGQFGAERIRFARADSSSRADGQQPRARGAGPCPPAHDQQRVLRSVPARAGRVVILPPPPRIIASQAAITGSLSIARQVCSFALCRAFRSYTAQSSSRRSTPR